MTLITLMLFSNKAGDACVCWVPIVAILVLSVVLRYFSIYINDEMWKGMMPMAKTVMETLWAVGTSISAAFIFLLA
jgi:hypothetical protein